jgi:hypothetical protein
MVSATGLITDRRVITGEAAWIKPTKFSISLATYGLTLLWYSNYLPNHLILIRRLSRAALIGTIIELSAIITQVLRGTTSHFNTSSLFNHIMFWITTSAIVPVAGGVIVLFAILWKEKRLPPVLGAALRWAVFLTVIGFVPGILMILPDRLQDAITCYKQFDGHTVGFGEGGPGIPLLGWSTVAGDLRIAHFVGIHALQVLPIAGIIISLMFSKLSITKQKILVAITGISYASVIVLLTVEAISAESLFAPGLQSKLLAFGILALWSVASAITIWTSSPPHQTDFAGRMLEQRQPN